MKKLINKYKNYHPSKTEMLLYLLLPIFISFFIARLIDNDFWFLINTGKYIINNGFPMMEPFTIHSGMSFVVQQWLSDVIFYFIYYNFSYIGITIFTILMNLIIIYLLYRICMIVSDGKVSLSVIVTDIKDTLLLLLFIRTRPQIFDFIILLSLILIMEKYIRKKDNKLLLILPLLSLLLINLHSSSWFMLFLFYLPYLIDSFKFKLFSIKSEGYFDKNMILVLIPMFLAGFINPYGVKAITYIFTSFGVSDINFLVNEMHSIIRTTWLTRIYILVPIIILLVINIVKRRRLRIRYICLTLGTIILSLSSVKGYSFFLIGCMFSISYYLKDYFQISNDYVFTKEEKIKYIIVLCLLIIIPFIFAVKASPTEYESVMTKKIVNYLNKTVKNKDDVIMYTDYDCGSFLEWNGYHVYIDPRAEVFLKKNNKKYDIFHEYYSLRLGMIKPKKFIDKYGFNYLIVNNMDPLYKYLKDNNNYDLVYKEKYNYDKDVKYYYLYKIND